VPVKFDLALIHNHNRIIVQLHFFVAARQRSAGRLASERLKFNVERLPRAHNQTKI
jgi:hypothetical protein